jgi:hypothetical protein
MSAPGDLHVLKGGQEAHVLGQGSKNTRKQQTSLARSGIKTSTHLVIHMFWKVDSDDRMEPPIQTRYLRSGGATTRTFTAEPPSVVTSLNSLHRGGGVCVCMCVCVCECV